MRRTIGQLLLTTGLDRALRRARGARAAILAFHRVVPPAPTSGWRYLEGLEIATDALAASIDCLKAEGFRPTALADLPDALAAGERAACLTFDDGYRDNLTLLPAVLAATDAPATVFVATGFVDRTAGYWWYELEDLIAGRDEITLEVDGARRCWATIDPAAKANCAWALVRLFLQAVPAEAARMLADLAQRYGVDPAAATDRFFMTPSEVQKLAQDPRITIGAHTVDHHPLARLGDADAADEIARGRARLVEITGRPIDLFAYPYGDPGSYGARDVALARAAGFTLAVSSRKGLVGRPEGDDWFDLPRLPVWGGNAGRRLRLTLAGRIG